jgi:hypothetical protein
MGSSVSPILAILFMDTLERRVFLSNQWISSYSRYVDDIFILTLNKEKAQEIHTTMNTLHPDIQFEVEYPTDENTLRLLDFEVQTDKHSGALTFQFYKKKARKNVFLNYHSALPTSMKDNIISNERNRIMGRCSSTEATQLHNVGFDKLLRDNDFPQFWINKNKNRPTRAPTEENTRNKPFYMKLSFINDEINSRLRRIFIKNNINIRFYYDNPSLRNILNRNFSFEECLLPGCTIKNAKLCLQSNIVYEITCSKCKQVYIGSTIRNLHTTLECKSIFPANRHQYTNIWACV